MCDKQSLGISLFFIPAYLKDALIERGINLNNPSYYGDLSLLSNILSEDDFCTYITTNRGLHTLQCLDGNLFDGFYNAFNENPFLKDHEETISEFVKRNSVDKKDTLEIGFRMNRLGCINLELTKYFPQSKILVIFEDEELTEWDPQMKDKDIIHNEYKVFCRGLLEKISVYNSWESLVSTNLYKQWLNHPDNKFLDQLTLSHLRAE